MKLTKEQLETLKEVLECLPEISFNFNVDSLIFHKLYILNKCHLNHLIESVIGLSEALQYYDEWRWNLKGFPNGAEVIEAYTAWRKRMNTKCEDPNVKAVEALEKWGVREED